MIHEKEIQSEVKFILQKYIHKVLKLISTSSFLDPEKVCCFCLHCSLLTPILSTKIIDQTLESSIHLVRKTDLPPSIQDVIFLANVADSNADLQHII